MFWRTFYIKGSINPRPKNEPQALPGILFFFAMNVCKILQKHWTKTAHTQKLFDIGFTSHLSAFILKLKDAAAKYSWKRFPPPLWLKQLTPTDTFVLLTKYIHITGLSLSLSFGRSKMIYTHVLFVQTKTGDIIPLPM